jgi:copper transport protein
MTHRDMLRQPASRRGVRAVLVRAAVVLVAAAIGAFAAPAAPAYAHATLVGTKPARNSIVNNPPTEVVLTFSEPVRLVPDRIRIVDPNGDRADGGQPRVDGQTVRIGLRAGSPNKGTYVVSYRVISADNHPVGGSFPFSVVVPSATVPTVDAGSGGPGGAVAVAFPVVRGLGYAGLALLVGAALVLILLWPRRLDRRVAVRLLWVGAVALAVASLLEVLLEIWYVSGPLADVGWSQAREVVFGQYGVAHAVRIVVALAAPLLLRRLVNGDGGARIQVVAVVVAVIGLATWPVSGHPAASPVPLLSLVADLTHLAAMSVWLGGLAMLAVVLLPRAKASELAAIVPVWSRWAQLAVAVLLATGVLQALIEVGTVDALIGTTYGWLVVAKVGLLAAVLVLAWQSRRLVPHVAARTDRAAGRLRALVAAEAAGIAVVVAVASVLVQTPPARSAAAAAADNEQTVVLTSDLYRLSVQILPGTVGLNELHLYAYTLDGAPANVQEWRASASNEDIEPIAVDLLPVPPDHAIGQVTLPDGGAWTFTFTLRTTEIDQATVTTTFDIANA